MKFFCTSPALITKRKKQRGSMLLELLIAMVVLVIGLGGILVLLLSSMYTNNNARTDTSSTMVAEHVLEQLSSEPANSTAALSVTDCAGNAWTINPAPAVKGSGNSNSYGGNGADLTNSGIIDWTQSYSNVPAGYAARYVGCGSNGRQTVFDVRWNLMTMSTYTRMVVISARPTSSAKVGSLRYIVPVNLRTIGGM